MKHFSLFLLFLFSIASYAQSDKSVKASSTGHLQKPIKVASLAQQIKDGTFIAADPNETQKPGHPKQRGINHIVPGKGLPLGDDALVKKSNASSKKKGA